MTPIKWSDADNTLENLIAQVSEITSDEIIITDKNQKIIYVNPAFTEITGFLPEEVIGKKPSVLKSGKHSERFYKKMWDTLNQGQIFKKIMINRHKSGVLVYEEKVIVPIKNQKGRTQYYVSTGRDVTQRIELQKRLKRKTALLSKSNHNLEMFVYKAAHDIRGPLASIIGIANIFNTEIKDEKSLVYCNYVKQCAQNLDEILKGMLHLQVLNKTVPEYTKINFTKIIDRILNSFKYYEGFENAKFNVLVEVETFYSDESMIFSILQNLVHNGVKFRKQDEPAEISITIIPYRKGIKMVVKDNGIGIKKIYRDKIFTMFYRANTTHKGSGLGLYFVDQMVSQLKGKIIVTSQEKEGTCITIILPPTEEV